LFPAGPIPSVIGQAPFQFRKTVSPGCASLYAFWKLAQP